MKCKFNIYLIIIILATVLYPLNSFSQRGWPPIPLPYPVQTSDLYTTGINLLDPEIPDTLSRSGITREDIKHQVKDGIMAVGWSQNQLSPYYIEVNINQNSMKEGAQIFTISVNYGNEQMAMAGSAGGMTNDVSLSKTLVISGSNYTQIFNAVNDLTIRAAKKLRARLFDAVRRIDLSQDECVY